MNRVCLRADELYALCLLYNRYVETGSFRVEFRPDCKLVFTLLDGPRKISFEATNQAMMADKMVDGILEFPRINLHRLLGWARNLQSYVWLQYEDGRTVAAATNCDTTIEL